MAAIALRHFDVLDYIEKSKAMGVDERVAKYQARQFEQVFDAVDATTKAEIQNQALATKHDIKELDLKIEQVRAELKGDIYKAKFEIVVWVAGLLLASGVIQGLIQHLLK